MAIPYQTQLSFGWTRLGINLNIVAVLIVIPAIIWSVPRYGSIGAAWTWVGLNSGYILIGIQFMHRRILRKEQWNWYRYDVFQPVLTSCLAVGAIKSITHPSSTACAQAFTLIIATTTALGASGVTSNQIRGKAVMMLKSIRKKT